MPFCRQGKFCSQVFANHPLIFVVQTRRRMKSADRFAYVSVSIKQDTPQGTTSMPADTVIEATV